MYLFLVVGGIFVVVELCYEELFIKASLFRLRDEVVV